MRLQNNETQVMLGEILGYGATTIANYERGYRLLDLVTAYEKARYYQISMEERMIVHHES